MSFLDPALVPSRQIVKHLAQMLLDLTEKQLLAVLRRKHDVVAVSSVGHRLLRDSGHVFTEEHPGFAVKLRQTERVEGRVVIRCYRDSNARQKQRQ
jgi:hypothetical protein